MSEKEYDLGFGYLGNGTTVWNRLEEVDNDYKTIAHISDDGKTIKYYEELPDEVRKHIEAFAEREKTEKGESGWTHDSSAILKISGQSAPSPSLNSPRI